MAACVGSWLPRTRTPRRRVADLPSAGRLRCTQELPMQEMSCARKKVQASSCDQKRQSEGAKNGDLYNSRHDRFHCPLIDPTLLVIDLWAQGVIESMLTQN